MDRDGVKRVDTGSGRAVPWLVASALALLGVSAWLVARWTRPEPPAPMAASPSWKEAKAPVRAAPTPVAPTPATEPAPPKRAAAAGTDPKPPPAHRRHEPRESEPRPEDEKPMFTVNPPGEHAGIAAFPPPGTKPLKQGLVVPEDFELPEGYVRHYQTADDGRALPPILMFHPDYHPVDADGKPIALPEDRIVPPEMAPPGLPLRTLQESDEQPGRVGRAR